MVNPMPYTSLNLQFWRLHTSHLEGKLLGILGMVYCIGSTVDVFVESFVGSFLSLKQALLLVALRSCAAGKLQDAWSELWALRKMARDAAR